MTIYLASDHAGFDAKRALKAYLAEQGYELFDCGALIQDPTDDYPDYVTPCAKLVANDPGSFGIVIGASGQGEAMAANRIPGVRCAVYYGPAAMAQKDISGKDLGLLESSRAHNDANMLSLGARFMSVTDVEEAVIRFLATPFSNDERHMRRIKKF